jgi:hypothetical protein
MANPNEVNSLLIGGQGADTFYQIDRSLRFNSANTMHLTRVFPVTGNAQKWTFSAWVKRSIPFGTNQTIFSAGTSTMDGIFFNTSDQLQIYFNGVTIATTSADYRDDGAWMHIILAVDTTQFTPADRFKLYINGELTTSYAATSYPVQNALGVVNSATTHWMGRWAASASNFLNGYMTEVIFLDDIQADPGDLGFINPATNEWQPIPYIGAYNSTGFKTDFADNSNTTSGTLGKDTSGNGNDWSPVNFSVTPGINNDSVIDVPTRWDDGANCRGNYPVWNGVIQNNGYYGSDGNLRWSLTGNQRWCISTINIPSTGQWYFECTVVTVATTMGIGVSRQNAVYGTGSTTSANYRVYQQSGNKSSSASTTYGASYTTNDVIGVAVDSDTGEITFYKNGASQGLAFNDLNTSGGPWAFFAVSNTTAGVIAANFGQQDWSYAPPAGFKPINTFNMPEPATVSGQDFCKALTYTGNGFVQSVTGLNFQPDLCWIAARNLAQFPRMVDSLRGAELAVLSGSNVNEQNESNGLTSFDPDGFTVGAITGASDGYNASGQGYASWNFVASPTTVVNTNGSITSSTRSNTTCGFSIVKYVGTGSNATVGHGCGGVPMFIIIKDLTASNNGVCYHASVGPTKYLNFYPNTNRSTVTTSATTFNNTAPSALAFSIGTDTKVNTLGNSYIAYVWSEVPGFSAYGSYSSHQDLPYAHCGFRPSMVIEKTLGDTANRYNDRVEANFGLKDDQRGAYGNDIPINRAIINDEVENTSTNSSVSQICAGMPIDILSHGFKLRGFLDINVGSSNVANCNNYGDANVYYVDMCWVAFASSPSKFTNAR